MIVLTALLVAISVALIAGRTFGVRSARRLPGFAAATPTVVAISRRRANPWRRPCHAVRPSAVAAWADDLARVLRRGSTLHAALTHTVPNDAVVEQRSSSLRHWLGRGATVADACEEWADELADDCHGGSGRRTGSSDRVELLATMSAVLAAAASLGGSAAAPLDRFAVTMRQRASDDLERTAQSAQARMSAKVLTSVPIAVLALLLLTDDDVRAVIASPAGATVVSLGLIVNVVGALWMRRIAGVDATGSP